MKNLTHYPDLDALKTARKQHAGVNSSHVAQLIPTYERLWRGKPQPSIQELWLHYTHRKRMVFESVYLEAGQFYELPNAKWFAHRTGVGVYECSPGADARKVPTEARVFAGAWNPRYPLLWSVPDYMIYWPDAGSDIFEEIVTYDFTQVPDPGTPCLLEMKNISGSQRSKWRKDTAQEGVPYYYIQVLCQLAVLEMDDAILLAKVDSAHLHGYHIKWDAGIFDTVVYPAIEKFWRMVETDEYQEKSC